MLFWLSDNWVLMALFAAGGWALSCVIDVYFVGDGIYRDPADGPLIAGLFCVIPLTVTTGTVEWQPPGWPVASVAAFAGVSYLLHVYFYFRALFLLNDAANAEIFNTLSVAFVPLLAFALLGERLAWLNYAAIGLAAAGILLLVCLQAKRMTGPVIANLVASVVFISLVMVLQAWVLERVDYGTAAWLFSLSAFGAVVLVLAVRSRRRRHVASLCRRFGVIFVAVELTELGAVFCSQRATDVGPSVSLVALLECTLPLFVMIFSWAAVNAMRFRDGLDTVAVRSALALQTAAAPSKFLSMSMILVAIFLVQ